MNAITMPWPIHSTPLLEKKNQVLSKHGARTCHSRMSGDVFTVDACTVAAQCLGLLAAVNMAKRRMHAHKHTNYSITLQ